MSLSALQVLGLLGLASFSTALWSADGFSEEYLRELAELNEMLVTSPTGEARDISEFELDIQVESLERLVLVDRLGTGKVYYYVPFRLRNSLTTGVEQADYVSRYNEVLAQIAQETQGVSVTDGRLVVDTAQSDDPLATVLDRGALVSATRRVQLTVSAEDENGTRMALLDDIYEGSQDAFNLADQGRPSMAIGLDEVRKRIEESQGRRLLLPSEIAQISLPPFDASRRNAEGVAEGEVFGVVIFDDIAAESDRITVSFRGIGNKARTVVPVHRADAMSDYFNTRVLRRMYSVTFQRHGDEFSRDLDPFTLVDASWRWDDTFQRLDRRQQAAFITYVLENVADAQNMPNQQVVEEFLTYYRGLKEQYPNLPTLNLE